MKSSPPDDVGTPLTGAWAPLRVRVFRTLWIAGVVSNVGTYMHNVGAGWAISELTSSATKVSLLQTMWTAPGFLVALPAGALADAVDRRKLLLITQYAAIGIAAILAAMAATDRLGVASLLVLTFALSVALTLAAPAFMSLTPELVEPSMLTQAVGLNSVSMNLAQAAGPALAGLVIAAVGPSAVFAVNALSFLGIVIVVWSYRAPTTREPATEPLLTAMLTGVRYIASSRQLRTLVARVVVSLVVGASLVALLPLIARRELKVDAGGFGALSAALGIGAVIAVSLLPRFRHRLSVNLLVVGAAVVWSVGAVLLATTHSLLVACAGIGLAGAANMTTLTSLFGMYQALLPAWVRGRGSSVAMLAVWLGTSLGSVGWGYLGSVVGIAQALLVAAAVNVVVGLVAAVTLRVE